MEVSVLLCHQSLSVQRLIDDQRFYQKSSQTGRQQHDELLHWYEPR